MENIIEKASLWLGEGFDKETKDKVQELLATNPKTLEDSFYKDLAFGTGGMRGLMGVGTNRINKYTLGKNTQGLSNYLKESFPNEVLKVAIAYDCRHNSQYFAEAVAAVFSANGIKVYLFEDLRTTPELSFTIRHLDCHAGIVITASHNPPEYNGYKVYFRDGGQIVPPQDKEIIEAINALSFSDIQWEKSPALIEKIGEEVDAAFIQKSVENGTFDTSNRDKVKIVFTSLHGTSITAIPRALQEAGFTDVHIVEAQKEPNGDFPTVASPNPEEPEALEMATAQANEIGADIVIGTDPDSDRIGIAVRNTKGEMVLLNGNQTMSVLTDFLISQWKKAGKLNGKQFIGTTIVSTDLVKDIAYAEEVIVKIGLTGFKWIAKMIEDYPHLEFIGGGEESFGYMIGDWLRDKDAVTAAILACEIIADAKNNASSFYEKLQDIYIQHSLYKEHLVSLKKEGIAGAKEIETMLSTFRNDPLKEIDGARVVRVHDYQTSITKHLDKNIETELHMPKSNVLIYVTEDGTKIAMRPSGTEPKIKFYFSVKTKVTTREEIETKNNELAAKINRICAALNLN